MGNALDRLALRITRAITETIDPPESMTSQLLVTAYALNAARAGRHLLRSGYGRAAESQVRAMLESFAVIQSLHGDDEFARAWRVAATRADRDAFTYERLKKRSEAARSFAPLWDSLNEYVHTNPVAQPTISRRRAVFGYDLMIGPFHDPVPLAALLGVLNGVHFILLESLCENLVPPASRAGLRASLNRLGPQVTKVDRQRMRAAAALGEPPGTDGQPIGEQRRALAFLAKTAKRRGRRDIALQMLERVHPRRKGAS
jgi:hypothetical protein